MEDESLARVAEGMAVLDRRLNRLGSVSRVYLPAHATAVRREVAPETPDAFETMHREQPPIITEPYLRAATTDRGELFVPAMYVMNVTADSVVLNVEPGEVHDLGWDRRPAFIPED